MLVKLFQFSAIILAALSLVPAGAHLFALPGKIDLGAEEYLTVQQIYRGWALFGMVMVAAIVSAGVLAYLVRSQRLVMLLAVAGGLLIAATLVTFFIFIFPANQATENWTTLPANWEELRTRWEYTHATNAVVTFVALAALVLSALLWQD
jgi:hypothetical protein